MRRIIVLLLIIILTVSNVILFFPVKAEARTIVVPDDFPTLNSAISYANGGETVLVKKGTYEEQTLVINKTINLVGEDANNTIISLHPPWVNTGVLEMNPAGGVRYVYDYDNAIKITADNVKISGFTIISNVSSGRPRISGLGTLFTGNNIETGLVLERTGQMVIGNNVKGTISCIGGTNHTIANNTLDSIWSIAQSCTIENNFISGSVGIRIGGSGNIIFNNTLYYCGIGVAFWSYAADNLLYGNSFLNNTEQVKLYDTYNPIVGKWDNGVTGNYWSDYSGIDANGDGIGDTPYVINSDNIDHFPLMSPWTGSSPPGVGFNSFQVGLATAVILMVVGILMLIAWKTRRSSGGASVVVDSSSDEP
jgi:nitrous oxidase accessory protein NosD